MNREELDRFDRIKEAYSAIRDIENAINFSKDSQDMLENGWNIISRMSRGSGFDIKYAKEILKNIRAAIVDIYSSDMKLLNADVVGKEDLDG